MPVPHEQSQKIKPFQDKSRGCLIGLAVGDAIGTTLEFQPKGSFKPLTDMVGGGHFCLKKGYWTDDTSMALCLGHSLVECGDFNARDQMLRYCDWFENGYMSSIGTCFDIGVTVSSALKRFQRTGEPFSGSKARWSSGNGSIMRLAPIPIFYQQQPQKAIHFAAESSRTTHASPLCIDTCRYLSLLLVELINGADKHVFKQLDYEPETPELNTIKSGAFLEKGYSELTGSGYVIESLESALWCFINTDTFDECVLAAANLGNDADTTAAIAGQMAGAYYGHSRIRETWLTALFQHDEIADLADKLYIQSQPSMRVEQPRLQVTSANALMYTLSDIEKKLLDEITLPLNYCNVPSWLLGSLAYQRKPVPLEINGLDTWYQGLFEDIKESDCPVERAEQFNNFMTARFCLSKESIRLAAEEGDARPRPKVNYRRLLLGWLFDSDNVQGAAWRSWAESRFGLLTRFHEEPIPGPDSPEYMRFRQKCVRAIYNTNELYHQLDLLYCFCQQELRLRYPETQHLTLYRGCAERPEYEIDGEPAKLFNNLCSFSLDPEDALRFGSKLFAVKVPFSKIACFESLLPKSLQGEQEFMVLGGLYRVEQVKIWTVIP